MDQSNTPPENNLNSAENTPPPMPYHTPVSDPSMNHQRPTNSNSALWSMICSIVGVFTCLLTTLPGIILGHIALSKIKRANGALLGRGQAIAGIAVGYSSLLLLIPALAAISAPIIIRQIAVSRSVTAINNGKDVYVGLRAYSFDSKGFPQENSTFTSSNDYFRPLFETQHFIDERPFHIKNMPGLVEPDETTEGDQALSKGENAFSYVLGADIHKVTPLLVTPLVKNGNTIEVDTAAFGGKLVVVYSDGSAQIYPTKFTNFVEDFATGNPIFRDEKMWVADADGNSTSYEIVTPDL